MVGWHQDVDAMDSSPINLARAYMGERVTKLVGPPRLALTQEKTVTPHRVSPYQPSPYRSKNRQVAQDQEGKVHLAEGTNYSGQLESPPVARYLGLPLPVAVRGRDNMFGDKLRTPPLDRTIGRITAGPRTNPPGSAVGFPISREVKVWMIMNWGDYHMMAKLAEKLCIKSNQKEVGGSWEMDMI